MVVGFPRGTIRHVNEPVRVAMTLEQCWHRVPGGTAVAALEVARRLARCPGVTLTGVAARHSSAPPEPFTPTIPVAQVMLPRLAMYESWHRLRRPRVQHATGPIDVIHATTIAMPPRSAPLVISVHDVAWLKDPSHFTRRGLSFFNRGLELAMSEADLLLCSSRATMADLARLGVSEPRLQLVPLGVDLTEAPGVDTERVRATYGLKRPYLMWIGTVEPRKNLPGLLAAWRKLERDIDLALVGPRGWNENLDKLISDGDRSRVKVLGFVPQADKAPLLKGAEVFCFPSFTEGFGFPVLEAMTQGTPVVTSLGTSTEELGRGAAVLVEPRDADSIAAGIDSLLADPNLADKMAAAGRERAAAYTWEHTAERVLSAYRRAAA